MSQYVISLDQGTTSSRAIAFDKRGNIVASAQEEFPQIYPELGWVEHNPQDIWQSQIKVTKDVMREVGGPEKVSSLGITNQRETTVIWEKASGKPIYNAIVWQDRRTADFCDELKQRGLENTIREKTGLVIDAYFSASKIRWILNAIPGAMEKAQKGELGFGTMDCWLLWNLTGGKVHSTDATNASRTMLYNIHNHSWDDELLEIFDIPKSILPEVQPSNAIFGKTSQEDLGASITIAGIAGDQHAALFGQMCLDPGSVKNTYGTGCFLMMNTGSKPIQSGNNLVTTIGWQIDKETTYALEGSIFVAGALIQWLRDELCIIDHADETEVMANAVSDNGGVYIVPAFVGLGAPYWDQYARGSILGLTRGANKNHIVRAALEAIAFQSYDVIRAMNQDSGIPISSLKVDGGATKNDLLLQIQSNLLDATVIRPQILETTALGAAYFSGLATGFWSGIDEIKAFWKEDRLFTPSIKKEDKETLLTNWKKAVRHSQGWLKDE
ncbi:MAG: glycerol kinase GlpK [Pseudobacteriovorax sp.]|nr:glycerol kinase GlpK [Pseudobacteriovorax sp.]